MKSCEPTSPVQTSSPSGPQHGRPPRGEAQRGEPQRGGPPRGEAQRGEPQRGGPQWVGPPPGDPRRSRPAKSCHPADPDSFGRMSRSTSSSARSCEAQFDTVVRTVPTLARSYVYCSILRAPFWQKRKVLPLKKHLKGASFGETIRRE